LLLTVKIHSYLGRLFFFFLVGGEILIDKVADLFLVAQWVSQNIKKVTALSPSLLFEIRTASSVTSQVREVKTLSLLDGLRNRSFNFMSCFRVNVLVLFWVFQKLLARVSSLSPPLSRVTVHLLPK
jgi:hypothetical protein